MLRSKWACCVPRELCEKGEVMSKRMNWLGRLGAMLMSLMLVMSLVPTSASAATWKKTTLRKVTSSSVSTNVKRATTIKKLGRYKLVMKGGTGVIKFVAPKTKTYTFTFSNMKSSEVDDVACVIGLCSTSGVYRSSIKTNEGTRPRLPLVSSSLANGKTINLDGYSYRLLKTRYGKVKLKKGQKVCIVLWARDLEDNDVPTTLRLRIQ